MCVVCVERERIVLSLAGKLNKQATTVEKRLCLRSQGLSDQMRMRDEAQRTCYLPPPLLEPRVLNVHKQIEKRTCHLPPPLLDPSVDRCAWLLLLLGGKSTEDVRLMRFLPVFVYVLCVCVFN